MLKKIFIASLITLQPLYALKNSQAPVLQLPETFIQNNSTQVATISELDVEVTESKTKEKITLSKKENITLPARKIKSCKFSIQGATNPLEFNGVTKIVIDNTTLVFNPARITLSENSPIMLSYENGTWREIKKQAAQKAAPKKTVNKKNKKQNKILKKRA